MKLDDTLASFFGALADPTRLALMRAIWGGERCVCDLQADAGGKAQNLVSHHLGVLRRAGLVATRRDGHWIYYRPAEEMEPSLRRALTAVFGPARDAIASCPPPARRQ
ncbi:MAG: ArsR/SmtB family transcription factor [Candidatus Dormibacterales bacterium]